MNLSQIYTEILQTNTFNFIILVFFLAIIIKVCKVGSKIESGINNVKDSIDKSVLSKEDSIAKLKEAEEKVSNIKNEIKEIEQKNEELIKKTEDKILQETEKQKQAIEENTSKILDNKEREIVSRLSKNAILASIELAAEHVKNLLNKNPEYHEQFIDKSIKELIRLKK